MKNAKYYTWLSLLNIIFIFSCLCAYSESEYKLPDDCAELLMQLRYEGIVRKDLMTITYQKKNYLPLLQILGELKIYYTFDYSSRIIEGYYISKDSTFSVDFRIGKGSVNKNEIILAQTDYLNDALEVYVLPDFFKKLFNFEMDVRYLKLTVDVESKVDLPIMEDYKRFKGYSFLEKKDRFGETWYPVKFDRNMSIIDGGTIYYDIRASQSNNQRSYGFSSNAGLELLGGDFQVNAYGTYTESTKLFNYDNKYRWRFNLGENNYLTNISLGDLSTYGYRTSTLPSLSLTGIQFTNEAARYQTSFNKITYEEQLEPGWQVELYKNGFLFEHKETDIQGWYRFDLPVEYGSANIELRFYGPRGEYQIKKELIQIPNEFVTPGDIKYTLNFGEREYDKMKIAEARLSAGITNWLSNSISISKRDPAKAFDELFKSKELGTFKNIDIYNSLALRIFSNLYTTLDYSLDKLYTVSLNYWPLDFGSYRATYTLYKGNSELNYSSQKSRAELYFQLPKLPFLPFNINANIQRNEYENSNNYTLYSSLYFNIYSLMLSGNYRANYIEYKSGDAKSYLNHSISLNLSYNMFSMPKFLSFMNNINLTTNFDIDLTTRKLQNMGFSFNQSLFQNLYLSYNLTKSFGYSNQINMALSLRLNLDYFRSETKVQAYAMKDMSYEQELQGILGFNSSLGEFLFSNSTVYSNIGSGAANIRVFLDANGNSKYDDDEMLIPDVRVNIPQATINQRSSGDMIQVYNLTPYSRYNVIVDKASFKNPLFIPEFSEFSFIADPNVYKPLDIPCYAGAVIEGSVYQIAVDGTKTSQPGVKIHILKSDSTYIQEIPVFSDGSFYFMGVPPGDYTAWVDSLQLAILRLIPEKPSVSFNVPKSTEGSFVEGLEFGLKSSAPALLADKKQKSSDTTSKEEAIPVVEKNIDTSKVAQPPSAPPKPEPKKLKLRKSEPQSPERKKIFVAPNSKKLYNYSGVQDIELTEDMKDYLWNVAEYLKAESDARVAIVGHTDNFGVASITQKVSEDRAHEAEKFLISLGIEKERILSSGEGSLNPIANNITSEGRRQNRRLEITIIKESAAKAPLANINIPDSSVATNNIYNAPTPEPPKPKVNIYANNIKLFAYGNEKATNLSASMQEYLDAVTDYLKSNPVAKVAIVGHTDTFGSSSQTQQVSEKRADEAAKYLMSKGIPKERILARGDGSRNPIANNISPEGRRQNRRLEIKVIE